MDWVTIIVHVASFMLFIFSQMTYMIFQVDSIKNSNNTTRVVLWPNLIRQFVGSASQILLIVIFHMLIKRYHTQNEAQRYNNSNQNLQRHSLVQSNDSEVSFSSDVHDTDSDRFGFDKGSEDSVLLGTFVKRPSEHFSQGMLY